MKVILINPKDENSLITCLPKYVVEEIGLYPHLGLAYIAGMIERANIADVEILDMKPQKISYKDLSRIISQKKPDLVGITATTFTLLDAIITAKIVKSVNRDIHVCVGGPHPSIYPKETVKLEVIDSVVVGEGEETFLELIKALNNNKKDLRNIKGLVFKDEQKNIIDNGKREFIKDLDSLAYPARHLLPYKKYYTILGHKSLMTTLMTTRGCPYNCLFCYHSFGRIYRERSVDNIIGELEECLKLGIKYFFIFDDIFTLNKKRTIKICKRIKEEGLDINFSVRARVDTVDNEILTSLRRAGCDRISFGLESASPKVLSVLRKNIDLNQAEKVIREAKALGFIIYTDFMIGSPSEDKKDIYKTIDFAIKLNPDYLQFSITTPYPMTDLYKLGLDKGLFNDFWQEFAENPSSEFVPKFWEEHLSKEELIYLLNYAYKRFYLRPSYILKRFFKLKSKKDFFYKAKACIKLMLAWKKKRY